MITDTELAEHRADALERMLTRGDLRRPTGRKAQNPDTGREEPVWQTVHNDLPARLCAGRSDGAASESTEGGVTTLRGRRELHFPHDTRDVRDGDLYAITSGEWPGSVWQILDAAPSGDQTTARRMTAVEVPRPTEWGAP